MFLIDLEFNKCIIKLFYKMVQLLSLCDRCKTQEMCMTVADKYEHVLEFFPYCFKIQELCNKSVIIYPSTKRSFSKGYKLKKNAFKLFLFSFFYFLNLINIILKECLVETFLSILLC